MIALIQLLIELITPYHCPLLYEAMARLEDRMMHCEHRWSDQCAQDWATYKKLDEWKKDAGCVLIDLPEDPNRRIG